MLYGTWAGKVARMFSDRLAHRATFWRDLEWWSWQPRGGSSYGARPIRARRGHTTRWEADLQKLADANGWGPWRQKAQAREEWEELAELYVETYWR